MGMTVEGPAGKKWSAKLPPEATTEDTISTISSAPVALEVMSVMNRKFVSPEAATWSLNSSPFRRKNRAMKTGSCRSNGRQEAKGFTLFSL